MIKAWEAFLENNGLFAIILFGIGLLALTDGVARHYIDHVYPLPQAQKCAP